MARFLAERIKAGLLGMEEVPSKLYDEVMKILEEGGFDRENFKL